MHNTALHTVQYISAVQCTTCMYSAATVQLQCYMYVQCRSVCSVRSAVQYVYSVLHAVYSAVYNMYVYSVLHVQCTVQQYVQCSVLHVCVKCATCTVQERVQPNGLAASVYSPSPVSPPRR